MANIFEPGKMMHIPLPPVGADVNVATSSGNDFKSFIFKVFPTSIVDAMAKNEILPIVIFSLFFGLALGSIGEKGRPISKALDALSEVMFKVTAFVMKFAPLGVFGALSAVIGKQGLGILSGYLYLMTCFYGGLIFFATFILGAVCFIVKINYIHLIKAMKEPLLVAFSTATSESAFPKTIR